MLIPFIFFPSDKWFWFHIIAASGLDGIYTSLMFYFDTRQYLFNYVVVSVILEYAWKIDENRNSRVCMDFLLLNKFFYRTKYFIE